MNPWFRFYEAVLDDPTIQRLPVDQYKEEFLKAIAGKPSLFSKYLKRGSDRPSATAWAKIRASVFQRDDYSCQYCGIRGTYLECDHVKPISRGGSNRRSNLKTACRPCNRSKRAKTLAEWRG